MGSFARVNLFHPVVDAAADANSDANSDVSAGAASAVEDGWLVQKMDLCTAGRKSCPSNCAAGDGGGYL